MHFEQQKAEREKKFAEAEDRKKQIKERQKERRQMSRKLQMKTSKGQPLMGNLMDVLLEKIERSTKQ